MFSKTVFSLNRPRSIPPRLSGQASTVCVMWFSLYLSLFWELRDKRNLKNLQ